MWLMGLALATELQLSDVLAVVDERVPSIAEVLAKRDAVAGKALASRGAFDPKLVGKLGGYADDPYDRSLVEAYLSARSPTGLAVAGGYRRGVGAFPPYDRRETNGELFVSAELPLLDGLFYGEDRVARDVADASLLAITAEVDLKQIRARRKATESYWKWVAAGRAVAVEQSILSLAEQRASMLQREVEEGSRPEFDVLDNERALFERKEARIAAEQKLRVAVVELSLWWRDERGAPQLPDDARLPQAWPNLPEGNAMSHDLTMAESRPDVVAVEAVLFGVLKAKQGAGNARLPDLVVAGEANRDFRKEKTELIGMVGIGSSLVLRKERGSYDAASADVMRVEALLRGTLDRARADILAAHAIRDTAQQRVEAASGAATRAAQVVVMERRRLELGSADLFQLLLRESNLEKARKNLVEAELELRLAEAAVVAAVGTLHPYSDSQRR